MGSDSPAYEDRTSFRNPAKVSSTHAYAWPLLLVRVAADQVVTDAHNNGLT